MDLCGVWHGFQALAHCSQGLGDKVGGPLVTKAKHHAAADVHHIALARKGTSAAAGDDVPGVVVVDMSYGRLMCKGVYTSVSCAYFSRTKTLRMPLAASCVAVVRPPMPLPITTASYSTSVGAWADVAGAEDVAACKRRRGACMIASALRTVAVYWSRTVVHHCAGRTGISGMRDNLCDQA